MEEIARYKSENMESGIQRNNIEKQIELLADSVELWAGTMNSEGIDYFFTVTDMDRNGRLELIVSSRQGTGLYTYSDYFEVNDTFDHPHGSGRKQDGRAFRGRYYCGFSTCILRCSE